MGNAQQTSAEARPTTGQISARRRPLACGSNCSLALAEDDIGDTDTQNLPMGQENHHTDTLQATNGGQPQQISHQRVDRQPLFWGEFAAGTIRLTKEEPMAPAQPQVDFLVRAFFRIPKYKPILNFNYRNHMQLCFFHIPLKITFLFAICSYRHPPNLPRSGGSSSRSLNTRQRRKSGGRKRRRSRKGNSSQTRNGSSNRS